MTNLRDARKCGRTTRLVVAAPGPAAAALAANLLPRIRLLNRTTRGGGSLVVGAARLRLPVAVLGTAVGPMIRSAEKRTRRWPAPFPRRKDDPLKPTGGPPKPTPRNRFVRGARVGRGAKRLRAMPMCCEKLGYAHAKPLCHGEGERHARGPARELPGSHPRSKDELPRKGPPQPRPRGPPLSPTPPQTRSVGAGPSVSTPPRESSEPT